MIDELGGISLCRADSSSNKSSSKRVGRYASVGSVSTSFPFQEDPGARYQKGLSLDETPAATF